LFDQGILELLWGQLPPRSRFTLLYWLMAVLVVALVAVSILLGVNGLPYGTFAFVSLGVCYVINFSIH
jgi:UDP-N-acetylmuramyl pentapeptide phosphotransferase/UDP-N-acetylglucosamine-1-phosphate transferase